MTNEEKIRQQILDIEKLAELLIKLDGCLWRTSDGVGCFTRERAIEREVEWLLSERKGNKHWCKFEV